MSEHDSGDEQPPTPLDRGQAFARCMRGFGNELAAMFGGPLYLVGSMLTSDAPGDIDLRLMLDANWRVTRITPIDQFLWSPHIEIVAQLHRG